jgi:transcriptional regulator with XRE-family HTH domain
MLGDSSTAAEAYKELAKRVRMMSKTLSEWEKDKYISSEQKAAYLAPLLKFQTDVSTEIVRAVKEHNRRRVEEAAQVCVEVVSALEREADKLAPHLVAEMYERLLPLMQKIPEP